MELEKLVARLFSVFPGADSVEHDVRIRGKSGIVRQIDVLIRKKIGLLDLLIVIDTKRKSRPVRRTDVLNVHDIKEDIGAALAVVIAPKGFDRGAKELAVAKDIQLIKSINTAEPDWTGKLVMPVWIDIRILVYAVDCDLPRTVFNDLANSLQAWRDGGQLPRDMDRTFYRFRLPHMKDGQVVSEATVTFQEKRYLRFNRMPLSFFGLFKESEKSLATERITTGDLSMSEIIDTWHETPTGDISTYLPLFFQSVQRGIMDEGTLKTVLRDVCLKMEFFPKGAMIDLTPPVTQIPFQFTFRPL